MTTLLAALGQRFGGGANAGLVLGEGLARTAAAALQCVSGALEALRGRALGACGTTGIAALGSLGGTCHGLGGGLRLRRGLGGLAAADAFARTALGLCILQRLTQCVELRGKRRGFARAGALALGRGFARGSLLLGTAFAAAGTLARVVLRRATLRAARLLAGRTARGLGVEGLGSLRERVACVFGLACGACTIPGSLVLAGGLEVLGGLAQGVGCLAERCRVLLRLLLCGRGGGGALRALR